MAETNFRDLRYPSFGGSEIQIPSRAQSLGAEKHDVEVRNLVVLCFGNTALK